MAGKLSGRKAIVTGAGRGIGRAIALAFAAEGAEVAVWDREAETAEAVAREIGGNGTVAVPIIGDVSNEGAVERGVAAAARRLGRIDILVNDAGIGTASPLAAMPAALWDETIAVNLRSVFLCSRAVLPGMVERGWGRIISISSQLAYKGAPERTHYAAAKAGILGFTRALALEVAQSGVTVNAICPGPIDTDMLRDGPADLRARILAGVPLGRFGRVDEVAPAAVFLASDEGSYFLGAALHPNGGDVMV
jgi:3-oxoacyl-[acyl-carrier protein] reductase